jgi:hypothetical protein
MNQSFAIVFLHGFRLPNERTVVRGEENNELSSINQFRHCISGSSLIKSAISVFQNGTGLPFK